MKRMYIYLPKECTPKNKAQDSIDGDGESCGGRDVGQYGELVHSID